MCAGELVRQAGFEEKAEWLGQLVSDRAGGVAVLGGLEGLRASAASRQARSAMSVVSAAPPKRCMPMPGSPVMKPAIPIVVPVFMPSKRTRPVARQWASIAPSIFLPALSKA